MESSNSVENGFTNKVKKSLPLILSLIAIVVLAIVLIYVTKNKANVRSKTNTVVYPKEGSVAPTAVPSVTDTSGQEEVLPPPAPPAN